MHNFISASIEKNLIIAVLALCLSLSWLIPVHQIPWMSFHSDALTALILLVSAWLVLLKKDVRFKLDALSLAVTLCIINIWSQYLFGKIASFGVAWIYSLYLIGFLLAMLIGRAWQKHTPNQCSDFIFFSVLLGGLLSVCIQLCQLFEVSFTGSFVLPSNSSRYFANLGQPNQLGSLLILSILACAWFHIKNSINGAFLIVLAIILTFGLAMTGSRTGLLNMTILTCGVFFYKDKATARKIFPSSIWLLAFYYSSVYFQPWLFIKKILGYAVNDVGVRATLVDQARLDIWKGLITSHHDYFFSGYGWGQIAHSQTFYANQQLDMGNMIIQSHNLFLDIILWTGIPFSLILFSLFFFWAFNLIYKLDNIRALLITFFLLVLFIHSMLEFPLHYAYFLLPAGLMAGVVSQSTNATAIKIPKFIIALLIALSTAAYSITIKDYIIIEKGFLGLRFKQNNIQGVEDFPADSIMVLAHLRDYIVFTSSDPTLNHSQADINLGRKVVASFPSALGIYNFSVALAFSGNTQEAEFWLDRICKINNRSQCELIKSYWSNLVKNNTSITHVRFAP